MYCCLHYHFCQSHPIKKVQMCYKNPKCPDTGPKIAEIPSAYLPLSIPDLDQSIPKPPAYRKLRVVIGVILVLLICFTFALHCLSASNK